MLLKFERKRNRGFMKKITLFLASSAELKADREQFELEIYRKCKAWHDKGIFLHLEIWEDHTSRLQTKGTQNAYNKKIKASEIFVLLAYSKIGIYTAEEFEHAFGQFQSSKKPFIYTYFKIPDGIVPDPSLLEFQQKLSDLNHFYCRYKDANDLWNQFNKELERLLPTDFRERPSPKRGKKQEPNVSNIDGDGNIVFQGITGSNVHLQVGQAPNAGRKLKK
jgi:hypothetical protein